MSRVICCRCQYPKSACVCASVAPLVTQSQFIVLQHPSEVGHAKNSVRLMQLVMPKLQVIVGENEADFHDLKLQVQQSQGMTYLLYPGDNSRIVGDGGGDCHSTFILLDGTWRKAYRMLKLNPWLQQLPALHLDLDKPSNYRIRKSSRSDSLSTLEATALTLNTVEPLANVTALYNVFNAMVEQRINAMPAAVRERYR